MSLHSKDGETWMHGVSGPNEFTSCNAQGCYLWDGVVEDLYGDHAKFWAFPQDGSLSPKWAMAGTTVCTVSASLKCATGEPGEKPQPRPIPENGIFTAQFITGSFADGCLECIVHPFTPNPPSLSGMVQIVAWLKINVDGSVADVSLDRILDKGVSAEIARQLSDWTFEPVHKGSSPSSTQISVDILLMCHGWPGKPDSSSCILSPGSRFVKPGRNPPKT